MIYNKVAQGSQFSNKRFQVAISVTATVIGGPFRWQRLAKPSFDLWHLRYDSDCIPLKVMDRINHPCHNPCWQKWPLVQAGMRLIGGYIMWTAGPQCAECHWWSCPQLAEAEATAGHQQTPISLCLLSNRPLAHIPQGTVHIEMCTHVCTSLLQNDALWDRYLSDVAGLVRWSYFHVQHRMVSCRLIRRHCTSKMLVRYLDTRLSLHTS